MGCADRRPVGAFAPRLALVVLAVACGTEVLVIDETTELDGFRDQLRWNDLYHHLAKGL